jgi:hypothetical protein
VSGHGDNVVTDSTKNSRVDRLEAAHPEIASRIAEAMKARAGQIAELA